MRLWLVLLIGLALRVAVIVYAEWHDSHFLVKYTDIDYVVFTDAARFVTHGLSPFGRATYRYTPLLAYMLTPNVLLHKSFGKILFAITDLGIASLVYSLIMMRASSHAVKGRAYHMAISCAMLYLFNPVVFNVSTRGNADAIVALMVCATLYLLYRKHLLSAAICYGLAVHIKIYPIIFSLPLFLLLDPADYAGHRQSNSKSWVSHIRRFFGRDRLVFTAVSAGTFLVLTGFFYWLYGYQFLFESYLYHLVRSDNRHNFSVYFYHIYLNDATTTIARANQIIALLAFLPQFLVVVMLGILFHKDIAFCVFIQTVGFVTFNKVCTVQYFVWYLCLLPMVIPSLRMSLKKAAFLSILWGAGQVLWLALAYRLEFLGEQVFFLVWLCGIAWFCINIYVLAEMLRAYAPASRKLFHDGRLTEGFSTAGETIPDSKPVTAR